MRWEDDIRKTLEAFYGTTGDWKSVVDNTPEIWEELETEFMPRSG